MSDLSSSADILEKILKDYDEKYSLYESFTKKLHDLIEELLEENDVSVHSVTCRVKDRDKLKEKVRKSEGKYEKLEDITDIAGLRIVTYFADDVDVIADIIKKEFVIDQDNSIDRREIMQSDKFGYLSLHYVASLNEERKKLTEYRSLRGSKCEIQIRSILQHAWAEIEHDLGYKTELEIPWQIRRRFTRIAGLLEVADSEFVEIKNGLKEYEESISKQIKDKPEEVYIDKLSLTMFIAENKNYREINQEISTQSGISFIDADGAEIWDISDLIKELNFLKIYTISQLEAKIIEKKDIIIKFAVDWLKPGKGVRKGFIDSTIFLWYLNYCLAGETGSIDYIVQFLKVSRVDISNLNTLANKIIETYNKYKELPN